MFFAGRRFKKIVIASSDSGDGKSQLTLQIAQELALRRGRVVVAEADLQRWDMADQCLLQTDGERNGLAHSLAGDCAAEDILCPTVLNRLYLVAAGRPVVNPLPLFYPKARTKKIHRTQAGVKALAAPIPLDRNTGVL